MVISYFYKLHEAKELSLYPAEIVFEKNKNKQKGRG